MYFHDHDHESVSARGSAQGRYRSQRAEKIDTGSQTEFATPDTIPSGTTTTVSIPINGGITGRLDPASDVDAFKISVVKGAVYTISLNGTGLTPVGDTYLQLLDSRGRVIASDDDGGIGTNSLLTFKASASGTFYVKVSAFTSPDQAPTPGDYTVTVNRMATDSVGDTIATAGRIGVDSSIVGFTETTTDGDLYRISLTADQYYEFQVAGGADYNSYNSRTGLLSLATYELDTRLAIYDASGKLLTSNNDISNPDDVSSALAFVPKTTGDYFVRVNSGGQVGGYNLQNRQIDLSGLDPRDTIDWGTKLASNQITVYFAKAGEVFDGVSSQGWNPYEIQQAMLAFQQYENIINVDVTITNDPTNATFKLVTSLNGGGTLGYFNPPGEVNAGVGVFWRDGFGWDEAGGAGLEQGGYGFITLIHEFGHAFGLAHPHDDGGTSTVMPGVFGPFNFYGAYDLNQGVFSTMSYNDGWRLHPDAFADPVQYGYQGTMMALDISVLQEKYGAVIARTGNDTYVLDNVDRLGTFYETIWDSGGVDTIAHTGTQGATIDLRPATLDYSFTGAGALSWANGVHGGYTIANGVVIENATGGSGADTLVGNSSANTLTGGAGADTFVFKDLDSGDTIADFVSGSDKIDLRGLGFVAGEISFGSGASGTTVYGDVDGDGDADLSFLLAGSTAVIGDFLL